MANGLFVRYSVTKQQATTTTEISGIKNLNKKIKFWKKWVQWWLLCDVFAELTRPKTITKKEKNDSYL